MEALSGSKSPTEAMAGKPPFIADTLLLLLRTAVRSHTAPRERRAPELGSGWVMSLRRLGAEPGAAGRDPAEKERERKKGET